MFETEADLIADQEDLESDSDESFDDRLDNMDEEEFMLGTKSSKKKGPIGKKNAIDRTGDTNAEVLQEKEDEADDTVFIDNLPRDEVSLKNMIKEVNYHLRDLEKQFFPEEDSEGEMLLKQSQKKL